MSIRRESAVEQRLVQFLARHPGADPAAVGPPDAEIVPGSGLTRRVAVCLFESMLQSRLQDLEARRLKDRGAGYYTIGSAGHETNAVFGYLLHTDDPAFLHYRSGAFVIARQRKAHGETPLFDAMLSFVASAEDPVSGGRHKVLGSSTLWIPPQTSTIASHLPKAFGFAYALARMERLGLRAAVGHDRIVYCSFGDASVNHATAQAGLNAAATAALQNQPCPVLFVCEDNGLGISVRTPPDFIANAYAQRAGLRYFAADGRDLGATFKAAAEAIDYCRRRRRPVFFHLRTVRLMGHAGTDVETTYASLAEIEARERLDPLLQVADLLLRTGALTPAAIRALYDDLRARVERAASEATRRPKLQSAAAVMAPLALPDARHLSPSVAPREARLRAFGGRLPEDDDRPRHLAFRLAQALKDLMVAIPEMLVFGEDVARKGGVYHVTDGLFATFGGGRVFNTILDETTILGLAQGAAQAGCLPFPEIQYLAYVHNALDQIRGEAASLQFFSAGRYANPMVVRIAGYAYQKGFGGHFHNDDSVGALLDIPGLIIASPARPDDAVLMLRTCAAAARNHGKVCLFLEPIALYMTKDLYEKGDGLWQCGYPPPEEAAPLGRGRVHGASDGDQLTLISWANGLYLSLQAQRALAAQGLRARVLDLRWLAPLPWDDIRAHARATGRVLVVDECRATHGGPSAHILAALAQ
ncbi:MAG TPA: thiamine pyrophosphate-dependent enzyme, partial [Planctomycetota bacterium]|nr:thiamine pyrophosphate-dependent enzyme [Planctomycetota bacterium]